MMLDLSPATEALARRLAETQRVSVDEAVRRALEAQRHETTPRKKDMSPDAIAARMAAIDRIVAEVARLPDLDLRTTEEIVDDINEI